MLKKQIASNILNDKENNKFLEFYEYLFKDKPDISEMLVELIIDKMNKKITSKEKIEYITKETQMIINISYLNKIVKDKIINSINKHLETIIVAEKKEKIKKNKNLVKKILVIILVLVLSTLTIYFAYKYINEILNFIPVILTILIVIFIFSKKFKVIKKIFNKY